MDATRQRSTAGEHRAAVMRTTTKAFAERECYGTSTMDVAEAASISQGYLHRLCKEKATLLAALLDC
ncbi:hypothetical protein ACFQ7B_42905 [Streptomyces erythrochromogenes]|uniref:hypothetical protein n=1 Tax=Streptomyces erythrochromogenes TaxID=285574 RepID=UPI0036A25EBC